MMISVQNGADGTVHERKLMFYMLLPHIYEQYYRKGCGKHDKI